MRLLLQIRRGVFQNHWLLADIEDEPRHPGFYLVEFCVADCICMHACFSIFAPS